MSRCGVIVLLGSFWTGCGGTDSGPTAPPPPPGGPVAPTQASSDISFDDITPSSLALSWTDGNGAQRVVVVREGAAVNAAPADGSEYGANAEFGMGDELGSGNFVVFNGSANSVLITGLADERSYHVAVYDYNGTGTGTRYLTASTASANASTASLASLIWGAWLSGTAGAQLSAVATLFPDGRYMVVDDGVADSGGQPGMEWGTYAWDPSTGSLSATPTSDTSGDWGLSDPAAKSVTIAGDLMTFTIGPDTEVLVRIEDTPADPSRGSWFRGDPQNATFLEVLTLIDGANYMIGVDDVSDSQGGPGMERGTYTWDAGTGAFVANSVSDTNGDRGLNPAALTGTITVASGVLTFVDGSGTTRTYARVQ